MNKRQYIVPLCEVVEFRSQLMKMTGPGSLPAHTGDAPQRRWTDVF